LIYTVLIIGLGQIGAGYDIQHDTHNFALTHARAFYRHDGFRLIGGVDLELAKRNRFESAYGLPAFDDVCHSVSLLKPDIVVISTPTSEHAKTVQKVLAVGKPLAILCEKPLSYHYEEANQIVSTVAEHGCQLFVNYMRISNTGVLEVKRRIREDLIKGPFKGVVWYSKGLFNNGSHFLNLLEFWLGNVVETHVLTSGRNWDGHDPEPDLAIDFKNGKVYFLAALEEDFSHYTIELVAKNGRLRYEAGGEKIEWQGIVTDPAFQGYTVLDPTAEEIATNFNQVQLQVVDELYMALQEKSQKICTGEDALQTLKVLANIEAKL
jgi:predicted dehydrogenase